MRLSSAGEEETRRAPVPRPRTRLIGFLGKSSARWPVSICAAGVRLPFLRRVRACVSPVAPPPPDQKEKKRKNRRISWRGCRHAVSSRAALSPLRYFCDLLRRDLEMHLMRCTPHRMHACTLAAGRRRATEEASRREVGPRRVESSRVGPRNASAHAPPIRTVCTLLARAARRARALANMSERIAPTAATATAPVYLLALRHSLAWRVKIRALLLARATCTDRLARLVNRPATR